MPCQCQDRLTPAATTPGLALFKLSERPGHKLLKEGNPELRRSGAALAPAASTSSAATATSPAVPPSSEARSPPSSPGAAACSASRIARLRRSNGPCQQVGCSSSSWLFASSATKLATYPGCPIFTQHIMHQHVYQGPYPCIIDCSACHTCKARGFLIQHDVRKHTLQTPTWR